MTQWKKLAIEKMFSLCILRSHAHVLRLSHLEELELSRWQTAAAARFTYYIYIDVQNVGKIRENHPTRQTKQGVGNELFDSVTRL